MSLLDTPTLDRRLPREIRKSRVHLSHSRSRQFMSLPMASHLHETYQTNSNIQKNEQLEETSPRSGLIRRGNKLAHSRPRLICSLNMHRVASSLIIATLFLTFLAFLTYPQFADVRLPRTFQTTIPIFGRPENLPSTNSETTFSEQNNSDGNIGSQSGRNKSDSSTHEDGKVENNEMVHNHGDDDMKGSITGVQKHEEKSEDKSEQMISKNDNDHISKSVLDKGVAYEPNEDRDLSDTNRDSKEVSAQAVSDSSLEQEKHFSEDSSTITIEQDSIQKQNAKETSKAYTERNNTHESGDFKVFSDPADFSTFSNKTTLNYFHLHKTGGVSFKGRIFRFFFTEGRKKGNGEPVSIVDTCYMSDTRRPEMGIEAEWSCNWAKFEEMSVIEREKIDVIVGHQYWERGAAYWVPNRDLRYFTVMRHPLHRKISFFYHFFVRNAGRSEDAVDIKEVIAFVLGRELPQSTLVRDAGPGYYASRLWSDGWSGFGQQHKFEISEEDADDLIVKSVQKLRRNFVFVGLQSQERASLCMLQKTILEFTRAHGIDALDGIGDIAVPKERMNSGQYPLTAAKLWEMMSPSEREEFKTVERVDLGIYNESVKMFGETVRKFECERFVTNIPEDFTEI